MTEEKLKELLEKVSAMSFEEGKQYIGSQFPNVNEYENYDNGVYDYDFSFDDELIITFTTSYVETKEELIADYNKGYWNINGERFRKTS